MHNYYYLIEIKEPNRLWFMCYNIDEVVLKLNEYMTKTSGISTLFTRYKIQDYIGKRSIAPSYMDNFVIQRHKNKMDI
jgi:hypothetical protein